MGDAGVSGGMLVRAEVIVDDDRRKLMQDAAATADSVADVHEREMHPDFGECAVSRRMREASGSIRQALAAGSGPAQVATPEYRASWERTFGGRPAVVGQA